MFGWTEIAAASQEPKVVEAIIPTIAVPFLLTGAIISSIVSAIAGLFGVQIKNADTPKKLLLALLKPRVLVSALILNAIIMGGYSGYKRLTEYSRPLWWIRVVNHQRATPSTRAYPDTWAEPLALKRTGFPLSNTGAASLSQAWETRLPDASFRGFTLSGPSAFTGSLDGNVYELDRRTGTVIRKFYIGTPSVPLPIVYRGTLFVGEGEHTTRRARIYAFDLATGQLKGAIQTKGHTEGDMVLTRKNGRTILFAAAGSDGLYAIDADQLEVLWHSPITHFDSGVTVDGERLFASTGVEKGESSVTPTLYALDIDNGKEIWKVNLAASGWSRPILNDDEVCVGTGEIYTKAKYGQFSCYHKSTGENRWAMNFTAPVFNTPLTSVMQRGRLLVADFGGKICSLDLNSHSRDWCTPLTQKGPLFSALAQGKDGLIMITTSEGLKGLDPLTGRIIRSWNPSPEWPGAYAGVTVGDDGFYVIDAKGLARKLELKEKTEI